MKIRETSCFCNGEIAQFVKVANSFRSKVQVESNNFKMNAKSLLGMMLLQMKANDEVTIVAEGEDAIQAVEALSVLVS